MGKDKLLLIIPLLLIAWLVIVISKSSNSVAQSQFLEQSQPVVDSSLRRVQPLVYPQSLPAQPSNDPEEYSVNIDHENYFEKLVMESTADDLVLCVPRNLFSCEPLVWALDQMNPSEVNEFNDYCVSRREACLGGFEIEEIADEDLLYFQSAKTIFSKRIGQALIEEELNIYLESGELIFFKNS